MRRLAPAIEFVLDDERKVSGPLAHSRGRCPNAHAPAHTSGSVCAGNDGLRRVCALPSCAHAGGQHLPSRCSSARCPATGRVGADHSVLLGDCTTGATAVTQRRLWRIERLLKPAEWWAFPGYGDAAMLNAITPPAALSGYKLTALELHVRTLPRGLMSEAWHLRPAATPLR